MNLISYGFRTYSSRELDPPRLPTVRVWKGRTRDLPIAPASPIRVTATASEWESLAYAVDVRVPVIAPVVQGQDIGMLVYLGDNEEIVRVPLVASKSVESAGFVRQAWDSALLGLSSILGGSLTSLRSTFATPPPQAVLSANATATVAKRPP